MKEIFETPHAVAKLIAETPCREGVLTSRVRRANPKHPESGRKRLREMAKRFRLLTGHQPYHVENNRFYPKAEFKRYCRQELKRYELN